MNGTREVRYRRRFDPSFVILGLGVLLLVSTLLGGRPGIANLRPVDLIYLLGTGGCLGAGLVGVVWHFDLPRKN